MILGAEPTQSPQDLFLQLDQKYKAARAADAAANPPVDVPPLAAAIVPGAILFLVKREKHPIVWWAFGVIPMAWAASRAIQQKRLW